jgi:hypothetical protein
LFRRQLFILGIGLQVEIDGKIIWRGHDDGRDILLRAYGNDQVRIMGAQLAGMDGTGVRCGAVDSYTKHIPKINLHKL